MTLSVKDFIQQVESEVEFRFDSYSHTQGSKKWSFAQWVLELLFPAIDPDQAFNLLANKADDAWNINASYRDEESGTFFILCTPYSHNPEEHRLGRGLIYSLLETYEKATGDSEYLPPTSVLSAAAQAVADGYALSIVLASFGYLDASVDLNEVRNFFGVDQEQFVYYDLYDLRRISAGLEEDDKPQSVTLTFESHIEHVGPVKAIVGNLAASGLAEVLKDFGPRIYDANLRTPLRSTKINKQMKSTLASSRRRFFWYYNNGITILCRTFSTKSSNSNVFVIDSPRIVNGAQTTDTILTTNANDLAGVHVLVRLIEALPGPNQVINNIPSQQESLQDLYLDIARYTNSQNPIEVPDFRSNEEVQRRLQQKFAELGWFYERSRGEWGNSTSQDQSMSSDTVKRIGMVELAQRWFAFNGNPAIAIRNKLSLFEEQGHYGKIFMLARSAEEYLLAYLLFGQIQERLRENIKRAKEEQQGEIETASSLSMVTRNYLMIGRATKLTTAHMTALLGMALKDRNGSMNRTLARELLHVTETGHLVKETYPELEDTLFRANSQLQQDKDTTLHRFLTQTNTLVELYEIFSYVLDRERRRGRDVFAISRS